jgi:hypothetical protein
MERGKGESEKEGEGRKEKEGEGRYETREGGCRLET